MRFYVTGTGFAVALQQIVEGQVSEAKKSIAKMGQAIYDDAVAYAPIWTGALSDSGKSGWIDDNVFEVSFGGANVNPITGKPTIAYAEDVEEHETMRAEVREDKTLYWYMTSPEGMFFLQRASEGVLNKWESYFSNVAGKCEDDNQNDLEEFDGGDMPF